MESALAFQAPANDVAPEPADVRLAALAEMREMGLTLMRELATLPGADAEAEAARLEVTVRKINAYATVTRALRLNLRQEAEERGELAARKESKSRWPYTDQDYWNALGKARDVKRDRARELMFEIAEYEIEDQEQFRAYTRKLDRRIEVSFAYNDFVDQPLRRIIEDLCEDTDFTADWSRWNGVGWNITSPRPAGASNVFGPHDPPPKLERREEGDPPPISGEGDPEGVEGAADRASALQMAPRLLVAIPV